MGKKAADPTSMFGGAIKAVKILDSAVNGSPDDIRVRLIRANQSLRIPEAFFKRTATAIGDFKYIIERYEKDTSILAKEFYWKILFRLGKAYQRLEMDEECRAVWEKLHTVCSSSGYSSMVARELEDLNNSQRFTSSDRTEEMDHSQLMDEGVKLHDMAVEGNKKAAKAACRIFERLYQDQPENALVEGYYGSSVGLVGRYSDDSQTMFGNAVRAIKLLKNAVSSDSTNVKLRLLRAYLLYNLPESFFHMSEKASKDFKFLVSSYERNRDAVPKERYWQILYDLGVCYERMYNIDKAKKTWKKLLKVCTDPKYGKLLEKKI